MNKKTILLTIAILFTISLFGQNQFVDNLNFNSGATGTINGPSGSNPLAIKNSIESYIGLYGGTAASNGAYISVFGENAMGVGGEHNGKLIFCGNTEGTHAYAGNIYFSQYDGTNWNKRYRIFKNGDQHWYTGNNGGVERLTLLQNGNFGIGTTNPSAVFEVNKSTNDIWTAKIRNEGGSSKGLLIQTGYGGDNVSTIMQLEDANGNKRMRVLSNGNIGIGTITPNEKLEIKDGNLRFNNLTSVAYGSLGKIDFYNYKSAANVVSARIEGKRDNYSHKDGRLSFYTSDVDGNLNEQMTINRSGNVGIGSTNPLYKLSVKGAIACGEVIVENTDAWADFVFEKDYNLMSLNELEKFINKNKHLPEIPTTAEVEENGISIGEMNAKLLQKIEELTLYVIELKKDNVELNKKVDSLMK